MAETVKDVPRPLDQWGRPILLPCPFCGAVGYQPNGKQLVRFEHSEKCWILDRHCSYGLFTFVSVDDQYWNQRISQ